MLKTTTTPDEDPQRAMADTTDPPGGDAPDLRSEARPQAWGETRPEARSEARFEFRPEACPDLRPEPLVFSRQFTSSPKGARLARKLAVWHLDAWGYPPASDTSCTVALLVGELTANAVRHGLVPGRDFRLRLVLDAQRRVIRVEVADASPVQPPSTPPLSSPDQESGRGLLLVHLLATRWGSQPRHPLGKTVWAEVSAEGPTGLSRQ